MIVAQIDRDYIADDLISSRVGLTWTHGMLAPITGRELNELVKLRFRLKDDDGEVYYGGWLLNDSDCEVQSTLLQWGARDAGCTTIEVRINGEWKQEIG